MQLGGRPRLRYIKRGKRTRWGRVAALLAAIGALLYFQQRVLPTIPPPFVLTPTVTRGPESFVEEAQSHFAAGRLKDAIAAYRQAIRIEPRNVEYYVALARIQIYAEAPADALEAANTALLINPDSSPAHAVRALALDWMGDYEQAADDAANALRLDPNSALAHAVYAEILTDQQEWSQASDEAELAVSLDPGLVDAHRAYGYVLESIGDYQGALKEYQAALAIQPNLAPLYMAVGRVQGYGLSDPNAAIESLQKAAAVDAENPEVYRQIARMYSGLGEYGKASQYAVQALQLDPLDPALHGLVGVMRYHNQEFAKAEPSLRLAVEGGVTQEGDVPGGLVVDPLPVSAREAVEAYYTFGMDLLKQERCDQATPIFQVVLTTWPDDELAVFNANEGLRMCREAAAATKQVTGTPATPTPEGTEPAPEQTPTPQLDA